MLTGMYVCGAAEPGAHVGQTFSVTYLSVSSAPGQRTEVSCD